MCIQRSNIRKQRVYIILVKITASPIFLYICMYMYIHIYIYIKIPYFSRIFHMLDFLGMLEKWNPHTLWARCDIMLDFWEYLNCATLTHYVLSSLWCFCLSQNAEKYAWQDYCPGASPGVLNRTREQGWAMGKLFSHYPLLLSGSIKHSCWGSWAVVQPGILFCILW